ncbi:putative LRR receptor-like serine/threonine-protein kinase-like [Capsicum annuum]|nr:putative LRR receptor-like serine/threonine-protein kinase-like [Capsicum annuum]KAF3645412.1 putative LRR receptor-like serine/threonine-protein kinase-like [Capsicum annuum]
MEKHIFLLILFFLVQYYSHSITLALSNETDQHALLAFRNVTTSPRHFLANNWTKNTSFCSWLGVTCSSRRQRVVALALPNLKLQGTIAPSLANFSFLSVLNLGNNSLHGDIPYVLGHLPRLWVIDIQNNQLQGSIPTSLYQHQRVQVISLAFNKIGGEKWKGPWNVPKFSALNLRNNSLTGIIPPSVGNATKLTNFSLSGNRINGNIPKKIGNLSQLAILDLHDNQLTGNIPATLFNISSLLAVSLRINCLFGHLLLDEGNIASNMMFLSISHNQISGPIPTNICQLTELKVLSISFNNKIGKIPRNIGCLSKLEEFYVGDNPIKGIIPTSMGNISTHQKLYCGNNCIVGQIPPELGELSNLRQLSFVQNYNLTGHIPEAIFNISSLEIIDFSSNNLSGRIPTTTGLHLPNLEGLFLGQIPLFITNASKLETLGLENNFLKGTIPTNLGNFRELHALILNSNQLTNEPREHELQFFNSLADSRMLRYLQVGSNPLNGVLPYSIGNLSSTIEVVYLADAHISGFMPASTGNISGLITLVFQNNNLMGNIPSEIGILKRLQGVIPSRLGELLHLQYLDLSSNSFSSQIPLSFSNLISLEYLDLSLNASSGTIPKSLEKLSYLNSINVSFKVLEGVIPSGGVFANSTLQSFLGNKGLCGMHILEVPPCPITKSGQQSKSKKLVLKIVIPVVTSSFMILFLVFIWIMKSKKIAESKDVEKIQRATSNFDRSNLIGVGSSGSVYKGTLSRGTVVAIKVLDLENKQVCKRFDTECEVMRNVRHRNLVPVITTCSSEYIRAFVLHYMSNGSVENWLYREDCHLNLLQRVIVMLDAAMAIEYVHHGYETSIVHCDLKPSNVLLDEDMVAHVGEFGISKILAVSKSMEHTKTLGTLGYIAPSTRKIPSL